MHILSVKEKLMQILRCRLMSVAIIGAGLAGLCCAHELERHGISPVIFERNSFIGEPLPHVGGVLNIFLRPIKNPLRYTRDMLGIDIRPLNTINRIIHHSPNKTTTIKGNLGLLFERSKGPDDVKVQIHSKLRHTRILFDTPADYEPLSMQYDDVVIANGFVNFTKELGCWTEWVNTYVRGAMVLGDFDPNTLIVWINKDYCRKGYAYLTPFDNKRASLILVVTDVNEKEVDHYWELFLYTEGIKYAIVEEYKLNHKSGYVYPHKVGNLFLTGNAGGGIDPFLGFGVTNSITTGVMAARAIAGKKDYEKLIRPVIESNLQLYEFRKAFNTLDNTAYDHLISFLGVPGIKHLIYRTPLNVKKLGSLALKLKSKGQQPYTPID